MIKVSIILTTYNSENKIQEVIDSIHKQEGRDELFELELLVVDDCSTDGTKELLHTIKNDLDKVFFHSVNRGKG